MNINDIALKFLEDNLNKISLGLNIAIAVSG